MRVSQIGLKARTVEAVDLGYLPALVVPAQQCDFVGVPEEPS